MEDYTEALDELYSVQERMVNEMFDFLIAGMFFVLVVPTPNWVEFPENYGLRWLFLGSIVIVLLLNIRYAYRSISLHESFSSAVKSMGSNTRKREALIISTGLSLLLYQAVTGNLQEVNTILAYFGLILVNYTRQIYLRSIYDVLDLSEKDGNRMALSADDISEMSESELENLGDDN